MRRLKRRKAIAIFEIEIVRVINKYTVQGLGNLAAKGLRTVADLATI